jgi:hypothetical protein
LTQRNGDGSLFCHHPALLFLDNLAQNKLQPSHFITAVNRRNSVIPFYPEIFVVEVFQAMDGAGFRFKIYVVNLFRERREKLK